MPLSVSNIVCLIRLNMVEYFCYTHELFACALTGEQMDYSELLNPEQLKPVYDTDGAVLVLAGAGSGKTRVLTYRIAYLIEHNKVEPYNILAITFTNKAANEMKERVAAVTGAQGVWISTFHSLCAKILRMDIAVTNKYTANFSIYTDSDSDKIITRIVKEMGIEDGGELKKQIRFHISNAKNHALSPTEYAKRINGLPHAEQISRAYMNYERQLEANNALDFDDLILKTLLLFKDYPEVLKKYQERFRYVHVDEFQDTNKIQFLLVRMLTAKYGNLFVVGDDDQSIYGWRGAEVGNILDFKKHFAGCRIYKLERNYRSTSNILDLANKIIAHNSERMGKTLWTDGDKGVAVTYRSLYDDRQEADFVIGEIMSLMRYNGYNAGDFAILVRQTALTRLFEEKLYLYNLPFKLIGGQKFYERKEIKDVLAYLKTIANPRDKESLTRIINVPNRKIGDATVAKLAVACEENGYTMLEGLLNFDDLGLSGATRSKVEPFAELIKDLVEHKDMPLYDFVQYADEKIDFCKDYDRSEEEGLSRIENVQQLFSSIKEFSKDNPEAGLEEYLQSVSLVSDTDEADDGDKVTVATVHGVKGLEYRCVFIVGLEDGIFPSLRASTTEKEIQEERRIMYVAVTRARERLYITNAQRRMRFGRIENGQASRFLTEGGLIAPRPTYQRPDYERGAQPAFGKSMDDLPRNVQRKPLGPAVGSTAQTQSAPAVRNADVSRFKVGMTVEHSRFGVGVIESISGENAKIRFEGLGVKTFNMRLAPIKIVL